MLQDGPGGGRVEGREEEIYLGWPLNEGMHIWGKIKKDLGCCFQ